MNILPITIDYTNLKKNHETRQPNSSAIYNYFFLALPKGKLGQVDVSTIIAQTRSII